MPGIPGVASPEGELSSSSSSRWHSYILIAVLKHPEFLNTLKSSSWNILKHSEIIILKHPEILKHSEMIWEISWAMGNIWHLRTTQNIPRLGKCKYSDYVIQHLNCWKEWWNFFFGSCSTLMGHLMELSPVWLRARLKCIAPHSKHFSK